MEKYTEKIVSEQGLFLYNSFLIIEGQRGLPDVIKDVYEYIHPNHTVWKLEEVFEFKERIKAIPYLNPDVIIFQTTGFFYEHINSIIDYLICQNCKPKEVWQISRRDIPIVDSDVYDVFSINEVTNNGISLTKL